MSQAVSSQDLAGGDAESEVQELPVLRFREDCGDCRKDGQHSAIASDGPPDVGQLQLQSEEATDPLIRSDMVCGETWMNPAALAPGFQGNEIWGRRYLIRRMVSVPAELGSIFVLHLTRIPTLK